MLILSVNCGLNTSVSKLSESRVPSQCVYSKEDNQRVLDEGLSFWAEI